MSPMHWADRLADAIKDFFLDMEFTEDEEDAAFWPAELEESAGPLPPPPGSWAAKYRHMMEDW